MKKNRMNVTGMMVVCSMLLAAVLLSPVAAMAQGGVNWKSTVINESGYDSKVTVYYGFLGRKNQTVSIADKFSHTFEFGADCPVEIKARMLLNSSEHANNSIIIASGMDGSEYTIDVPMCWNTNLIIGRNPIAIHKY